MTIDAKNKEKAKAISDQLREFGLVRTMEVSLRILNEPGDLYALEMARGVLQAGLDYLKAQLEKAEAGITKPLFSVPQALEPHEVNELTSKLPHTGTWASEDGNDAIRVTLKSAPDRVSIRVQDVRAAMLEGIRELLGSFQITEVDGNMKRYADAISAAVLLCGVPEKP